MKLYQYIFFLTVFASLQFNYGQTTNHLLLRQPNNQFIVLLDTGYISGDSNKIYDLKKYSEPVKLESGLKINQLKTVYSEKEVFLVDPNEGHVYIFEDEKIKRLDNDYRFVYPYPPIFFSFNESLYLVGGNFEINEYNTVKRFNFKTKRWDNIKTNGFYPKGTKEAIFNIVDDLLWIYNANSLNEELNEKPVLNAYSLDLINFEWKKQGVVNPALNNFWSKANNTYVNNDVYMAHNKATNRLLRFNILKNSLESSSFLFNRTIENFIPLNERQLLVSFLSTEEKELKLEVVPQISFLEKVTYLVRNQEVYKILQKDLFYAIVFFFVFGMLTLSYLRKIFVLNDNILTNGIKRLILEDDEVEFITYLAKRKVVLNDDVLKIVHNPTRTYDANIKRKNNLVSKVNRKIRKTFKMKLFSQERYREDMRQTAFYLGKGFVIKIKKKES